MSRHSRKNVGLIGLGIIGRRVAENLRKHGFHVFVWNRTPRPVPNFVGSAVEVGELCNVVQIFVADDDALKEMIQQLSPALTAHHIVLAHCTVAPETMQAAAETVQRRGARFLDAPFTGSKMAAENGELIYYVAGDDGALHEARRFLEASSKEIVELGEIGEATLIKLATNMVTAASVQSVAEALALVAKCGVSPEKLKRALRSNASQSATLAMKLPKMMEGDFEPHFSVKHMLKDLQITARLAQSLELGLPVTEVARDAQLEEMKHGRGDEDYCCVAREYFPEGLPSQRKEPESPEEPPVSSPVEPEPEPVSAKASEAEPAMANTAGSPATPENPPAETAPAAAVEEAERRRSFFSRLFGRDADY
jgi:3-hydroxyisobutyrate dehydrogenase-like beta-hydroxyacid dehydrogenase